MLSFLCFLFFLFLFLFFFFKFLFFLFLLFFFQLFYFFFSFLLNHKQQFKEGLCLCVARPLSPPSTPECECAAWDPGSPKTGPSNLPPSNFEFSLDFATWEVGRSIFGPSPGKPYKVDSDQETQI